MCGAELQVLGGGGWKGATPLQKGAKNNKRKWTEVLKIPPRSKQRGRRQLKAPVLDVSSGKIYIAHKLQTAEKVINRYVHKVAQV